VCSEPSAQERPRQPVLKQAPRKAFVTIEVAIRRLLWTMIPRRRPD
jgi:hypothetical protein